MKFINFVRPAGQKHFMSQLQPALQPAQELFNEGGTNFSESEKTVNLWCEVMHRKHTNLKEMGCRKCRSTYRYFCEGLMKLLQFFHLYHGTFRRKIICKRCIGEYGILECLGMYSLWVVRVYRTICHEPLRLLTNIKIYDIWKEMCLYPCIHYIPVYTCVCMYIYKYT